MANLPSHGDNMSDKKDHGNPGCKNVLSWLEMILHERQQGIITAKPVEPQKYAQDLWAARNGQDGFKSEQFPPINCKSHLAAALQLLYIASPEECLSLAKPYGSAWDLDEDHPAVRFQRAVDNHQPPIPQLVPWDAVATSKLFRAHFGVMIHLRNNESKIAVDSEDAQLWSSACIHRNWTSWDQFFELLMAPELQSITGNACITASQPFVKPTQLPAYFTIGMPHLVGQTLRCQLFPEKDYLVRFLTEDGSLAVTRMRWVGGIYRIGGGSPRVIFDWGDSDRSVGKSFNADWANHPPQRYSRPLFYSLIRSVAIAADLMIFRRVETGPTEGLNHSAHG
ncbi:uncharacterized protein J3D65DRAFT_666927 [Phyllosticta citribraziliensis]|uniref:Uncharacterized protein n=1 Tax=Phyllosticta citribraziliensis TaxID=989973 RepID=A0ABR1LU59_9PEZI